MQTHWTTRLSWVKASQLFPSAIAAASILNFATLRPTIAQTQTLSITLCDGVLTMSDTTGSEKRGDAFWNGERWIWMLELKNQTWIEAVEAVPQWARHVPFTRV